MTDQMSQADTDTETLEVEGQEKQTQITPEIAEAELKRARGEAAKYRTERNELARQIKDLVPKAEKGSELEKQLTDIQAQIESANQRATFMEEAIRPGVECRNPRAAFALALADNLFTKTGSPDWKAIKDVAPELFGRAPASVNANAGEGTGGKQPTKTDMNRIIRQMAGRE